MWRFGNAWLKTAALSVVWGSYFAAQVQKVTCGPAAERHGEGSGEQRPQLTVRLLG